MTDATRSDRTGLWPVLAIAAARLLAHLAFGNEYGFHRDELATLSDSNHLAWGYVAYPPLVPLLGRIGMELFGVTPLAVRWLSALAQAVVVVLAGLMARDLGGGRHAQGIAATAVAIAPLSMLQGVLFQYVSFDMLWWTMLAWLVIRLLRSGDPRWWVPVGGVIGLGMMTKYSIMFLVAGVVVGVLVTRIRRHLTSGWLWSGVVLSLLIFLPNFIWQVRHDFVSLEFLDSIHARDVAIGRTGGFWSGQLTTAANLLTVPIWIAGLWFLFASPNGRRFRMAGALWLVPLVLFAAAQGRAYYMAGAYPLLLAAGAVVWGDMLARGSGWRRAVPNTLMWTVLLVGAAGATVLMLPIAPVNSSLWRASSETHDNFAEQIGWDDLVTTVGGVYERIPPQERPRAGILTGNYGEAGALELLGGPKGLPQPISGVNSFWYRGYGAGPTTVIVLGIDPVDAVRIFEQCEVAARLTNQYGVANEESSDHPEILLCRDPRAPWSTIWPHMRGFG